MAMAVTAGAAAASVTCAAAAGALICVTFGAGVASFGPLETDAWSLLSFAQPANITTETKTAERPEKNENCLILKILFSVISHRRVKIGQQPWLHP
jgi:hypothetical protein